MWEVVSSKPERTQALGDSNLRGKPFDEVRSLTSRGRIGFGIEARLQAARDECQLWNARWPDATHHSGQQDRVSQTVRRVSCLSHWVLQRVNGGRSGG